MVPSINKVKEVKQHNENITKVKSEGIVLQNRSYLSHGMVCQEGAEPRGVAVIHKLTQVESANTGVHKGHSILTKVTAALPRLNDGQQNTFEKMSQWIHRHR